MNQIPKTTTNNTTITATGGNGNYTYTWSWLSGDHIDSVNTVSTNVFSFYRWTAYNSTWSRIMRCTVSDGVNTPGYVDVPWDMINWNS